MQRVIIIGLSDAICDLRCVEDFLLKESLLNRSQNFQVHLQLVPLLRIKQQALDLSCSRVCENDLLRFLVQDDDALLELVEELLVSLAQYLCLHVDHASLGHAQVDDPEVQSLPRHVDEARDNNLVCERLSVH